MTLYWPLMRWLVRRQASRSGAGPEVTATLVVLRRAMLANVLFPGAGLVTCGVGSAATAYLWLGAASAIVWTGWWATLGLTVVPAFALWIVALGAANLATRRLVALRRFPRALVADLDGEGSFEGSCPRCETADRTTSGWCRVCTRELAAATVPLPIDLTASNDAVADRDWSTALAPYARRVVVHPPVGDPRTLSQSGLRRHLRTAKALFPDLRSAVEASYGDPADPSLLWMRTATAGTADHGMVGLSDRRVLKYRVERGQVAEYWQYPALLGEPPAT